MHLFSLLTFFFLFLKKRGIINAAIFVAVDKEAEMMLKVLTLIFASTMDTEKIRCRFFFQMCFGSGTKDKKRRMILNDIEKGSGEMMS